MIFPGLTFHFPPKKIIKTTNKDAIEPQHSPNLPVESVKMTTEEIRQANELAWKRFRRSRRSRFSRRPWNPLNYAFINTNLPSNEK